MMSGSSARDSYVVKRPLMTITYCRMQESSGTSRVRWQKKISRWLAEQEERIDAAIYQRYGKADGRQM